jgi:hypothetical protein
MAQNARQHVWSDCENYYSWPSMRNLLLGMGAAAVTANTRIDSDFREWHTDDFRGDTTYGLANCWRGFGDGWTVVPAVIGIGLAGQYFNEYRPMAVLGEFGDRSWRAYLVGTPTLLLFQSLLGSARPGEDSDGSHWDPFESCHGVSGHAFIGAVPFITAAKMTSNPWAKAALYGCSTMPAWSRINDDVHYLSQVWLGWWLAYLACDAVDMTNRAEGHFSVAPVMSADMSGIALVYQR